MVESEYRVKDEDYTSPISQTWFEILDDAITRVYEQNSSDRTSVSEQKSANSSFLRSQSLGLRVTLGTKNGENPHQKTRVCGFSPFFGTA